MKMSQEDLEKIRDHLISKSNDFLILVMLEIERTFMTNSASSDHDVWSDWTAQYTIAEEILIDRGYYDSK